MGPNPTSDVSPAHAGGQAEKKTGRSQEDYREAREGKAGLPFFVEARMPLTYPVPDSVKQIVEGALKVHKKGPKLPDVHGVAIAEELANGTITIDTMSKMRRYFSVNEKACISETRQLKTEASSAVVRSWLLHGAEPAKAWVDRLYETAVAQGLIPDDPFVELLTLRPEEVYSRFSLGAWRYEYDLDPSKAARFVEAYMTATNMPLDLRQAFGESAKAVGNAIYRRYHTPNPFRQIYRAMLVRDTDTRFAAQLDLRAVSQVTTKTEALEEGLKPQVWKSMSPAHAGLIWPSFVAYFILAVENPELLKDMNLESYKPPTSVQKAKSFQAYNDPVNTYVTYFHPDGAKYALPGGKYAGVDAGIETLTNMAYYGKPLQATSVKKILTKARLWVAYQKLSTKLFALLLSSWNKGDWKKILENIPLDADVYEPFKKFTEIGEQPEDGVKLAQRPTDKRTKDALAEWQEVAYPNSEVIPLDKLTLSKVCADAKTPIGILSVVKGTTSQTGEILGAIELPNGEMRMIVRMSNGTINSFSDEFFVDQFQNGGFKVMQGHSDMPGTSYTDVPDEMPDPNAADVEDDIIAYMQEEYEENFKLFKKVPLAETETGKALKSELGLKPVEGIKLVHADKGWVFTLERAYEAAEAGVLVVYRTEDNEIDGEEDDVVAALITDGKFIAPDAPSGFLKKKKAGKTKPLGAKLNPELITYLANEAGFDEDSTKSTDLQKSKFFKAVAANGGDASRGTWWQFSSKTMKLHGSYTDLDGDVYIVWKLKNGGYYHDIDMGAKANYDMEYLVPTTAPADVPEGAPKPAFGPVGPKFADQTIIKYNTTPYQILAHDPSHYYVIRMALGQAAAAAATPMALGIEDVDESAEELAADPSLFIYLQHIDPGVFAKVDTPEVWDVTLAAKIMSKGMAYYYGGAIDFSGSTRPILALEKTESIATVTVTYLTPLIGPSTFFDYKVESSFESPEVTPEPGYSPPAKSGTQAAFNYMHKKGWKAAVQSESPTFQWDLGDVLAYGGDSTRTVIGYAFDKKGQPVYITVTDVGNVSWKGAKAGNIKYGPKLSTQEQVVDALLPKPGTEKPVFPKLNYSLTSAAKKVAQENDWTYVSAPKDAPFYVGTELISPSGTKYRLSAWRQSVAEPEMLFAVLIAADGTFVSDGVEGLAAYHPDYKYSTLVVNETGEVVFGKKPGDELTIFGSFGDATTLPAPMPDDWDEPTPIQQPAIPHTGGAIHFSAGVVVLQQGFKLMAGGATHNGILMVYPLNAYKGYTLTFPKGTVDKGEAIEKAAVREVMEETGLSVKPVAFLGDYKGAESITRMFIGYATGGNPHAVSSEVDAVTFKPFAASTEPGPWYEQLQARDKKIYTDAVSWVVEHTSFPQDYELEEADAYSAPTLEGDVKPAYNPDAEHEVAPVGKLQGASTVDYEVTDPMAHLTGKLASGGWHFIKALPFLNKGYPPPGVAVSMEAFNDNFEVRGYMYEVFSDVHENNMHRIVLRNMKTGDFIAPIVEEEEGGAWKTVTPPDYLVPMSGGSEETVPADTSTDDIWNTLLFKAPFPIGKKTVEALKKKAADLNSQPESFTFTKEANGVAFGNYFTPGTSGNVMAYEGTIGWEDTNLDSHSFHIGTDPGSVVAYAHDMPMTLDTVANAANTPQTAWFAHPEPDVMALIAEVFVNGEVKSIGSTMTKFKQWCKTAQVPNYTQITTNIVQDVASLFVDGAATKAMYDAVLALLKARGAASHKSKKSTATAKTTTGPQPTPVDIVSKTAAPAETIMTKAPSFDSPSMKYYVNEPQPMLFKGTGQGVSGGSKPNELLEGPGASKFLFKTGNNASEDWRADIDRAAYVLSEQIKSNNMPVGVMDFDGKHGSFQPFVEGANAPDSDPSTLADKDMAELLAQHAADMFMGDHDGHVGNWLRHPNGKLVAIDRGQAFKFLFMGKPESLDPHWHAPGNFGDGYAKGLLIQWSEGTAEIPESALKAMRKAIARVQAVQDAVLDSILAPVFEQKGSSAGEKKKVTTGLKKRRDNYLKDWTKVMNKLNADFEWPKVSGPKKPKGSFESSPDDQNFGTREEQDIADAVAATWEGKALQIDTDAIEDQNVMVRRVMYKKGNLTVPSTLVHFRVSRDAGQKASTHLFQQPTLVTTEAPSAMEDSGILKADATNGFWSKIQAAIKSVNFHFYKSSQNETPDAQPNMTTVNNAMDLLPKLQTMHKATADPDDMYATTGESNEAVHLMAGQYIDYLYAIQTFVTSKDPETGKPTFFGKHSPMFAQFKWVPPPEEERRRRENRNADALKLNYQNSGAVWPEGAIQMGGEVTINASKKAVYNYAKTPRFHIEDKTTGAEIFFNPPGGAAGVPEGVEAHKGMAWAIIPGEPTPDTVAHVLKMFEEATGVGMKTTTKADEEALYWSKQVSIMQGGGSFTPNSDGTAVKEEGYQKALALYKVGKPKAATAALKKIAAKKLGVPVAGLSKVPGYNPAGDYTRGSGWHRHERLGWDRDKMIKVLGKGKMPFIVHNPLYGNINEIVAWFKAIATNGALISNNMKPYYGIEPGGTSLGSDFDSGGTQGSFSALRRGYTAGADHLYLDISIGLRTDVYIVGPGDAYGNVKTKRIMDPAKWGGGTGGVGPSSTPQINIRHDADFQTYLYACPVGSKKKRDQIREICEKAGWTTFAQGRTIEQVITTVGSEVP